MNHLCMIFCLFYHEYASVKERTKISLSIDMWSLRLWAFHVTSFISSLNTRRCIACIHFFINLFMFMNNAAQNNKTKGEKKKERNEMLNRFQGWCVRQKDLVSSKIYWNVRSWSLPTLFLPNELRSFSQQNIIHFTNLYPLFFFSQLIKSFKRSSFWRE